MRVLAVASAAVVLAGCLAPASPADLGAPAGSPWPLPMVLEECTTAIAVLAVEPERLAPYLPEGFEPELRDALVPPGATAMLGVEAFACAAGLTTGGRVADLAYGSIYAPARPPTGLQVQGVDSYYVKWDTLVPDEGRREAMLAVGAPARDGSVSIAPLLAPAPGGAGARVELVLQGLGTFRFDALATEPPGGTGGFPYREFTPAEGGLVVWGGEYRFEDARGGRVLAELEPGSWVAEVVGRERVEGSLFLATTQFDADIRFVPTE